MGTLAWATASPSGLTGRLGVDGHATRLGAFRLLGGGDEPRQLLPFISSRFEIPAELILVLHQLIERLEHRCYPSGRIGPRQRV